MKGVTAALAGIAMLGLAGVANAEEASGKVVAMEGGVLILEDGTSFTISEGVSTEGLQPGMDVTVSYEDQGGERVATGVAPAQ